MKIVCASSLAMGREAFATLGDVITLPEREITPAVAADADALITRSKVRIDRGLLDGSSISFVGTATAGTDHMDLEYLNAQGIAWTAAPGSNANSVAEYIATALLCLANRHGFTLRGKTMAVIGVGHIGKLVVEKAEMLGLHVLRNDPPLFAETGSEAFRPLDEVLAKADIVTLHVPLVETDPYATRRLVNTSFIGRMKPGALFINASRGEVADTASLLAGKRSGAVKHMVLDVFEGEPVGSAELLAQADLISPHIAGYSHEGKVNGTYSVYREACNFFEVPATWQPPRPGGLPVIAVASAGRPDEAILWDVVKSAYDIESDDAALRRKLGADHAERGRHFDALRAGYPVRHEFRQRAVAVSGTSEALWRTIRNLGFQSLEK